MTRTTTARGAPDRAVRDTSAPEPSRRGPSAGPASPNALRGTQPVSGAVERRGVLVCHCVNANGDPTSPEWSYWRDLGEARQARDALTPCGPRCGGVHTCVEVDVPPPGRSPASA